MRILFMGTPDIAAECLKALYAAGHDICAVYTRRDKPVGRKQVLTAPPVKEVALAHGTPVFQPRTLRDGSEDENIRALAPELIVVVAYGCILPKSVLEMPRYGCINLHVSLLPKYRGSAPVQWSVLNGDAETGVSIMQMDEGLDTGDVLRCEKIAIVKAERIVINISCIDSRLAHRDTLSLSDEEHKLIKLCSDKMMTRREDRCLVIVILFHSDKHHFLREINISSVSVLLIYWSYHYLISKEELILCLLCVLILGEVKRNGSEQHLIIKNSFEEFAVQIRNKAVTDLYHFSSLVQVVKLIELLSACAVSGVIAEKRSEQRKL